MTHQTPNIPTTARQQRVISGISSFGIAAGVVATTSGAIGGNELLAGIGILAGGANGLLFYLNRKFGQHNEQTPTAPIR